MTMERSQRDKWSEDAAAEIARRCLNHHAIYGATLDVQIAAAIIRKAHVMQFGGEWEYCKPGEASEYWTGTEWQTIGMASVGRFERQTISRSHRRRVRVDD